MNFSKMEHIMNIKVQFKRVYGNELIYPVCDKSKIFAQMLNAKTLTSNTIRYIKDLGYTVEVMQDKPATL